MAAISVLPAGALGAQERPLPPITGAPSSTLGNPQVGPWLEAWAGFGFTNSFYGGYFGALRALNPAQNLWTDGFVLRFEGQVGHYSYLQASNPNLPNPKVDYHGGSIQFGYRTILGAGEDASTLTSYIGLAYQHHNNPDPGATIRGTEAGVKGTVEYYTPLFSNSAYFYGQAWAMTPFENWFAYAQLPFKVVDKIWFGPEAMIFGNEAPYREGRVGAALRFEQPLNLVGINFQVSGGYRKPIATETPHGYYVNFHLSKEFR